MCLASQPCPEWDGTYVKVASPADADPSLFVVIEMRGCSQIRFGAPGDEAMSGHPLYGKGLDGYQAHEVFNSRWIEEAITVNSVHPRHSDARSGGCTIMRCYSTTRCWRRLPSMSNRAW